MKRSPALSVARPVGLLRPLAATVVWAPAKVTFCACEGTQIAPNSSNSANPPAAACHRGRELIPRKEASKLRKVLPVETACKAKRADEVVMVIAPGRYLVKVVGPSSGCDTDATRKELCESPL